MKRTLTLVTLAAAIVGIAGAARDRADSAAPQGGAVPVKLARRGDGWTLLRDNQPYFVRGAGGSQNLEMLKAYGGNSIRTWGAETAAKDLDAARQHGLTMTLGIWLGHKAYGFKYDDPEMVRKQLESAKAVARQHRDHPALLLWGVGNEMEGDGRDDNVWKAVEEVARAIKQIDPNHPTMTVIAEIGEDGIKAKKVAELCPSIDILGVNSYGGLDSMPTRLKAAGWTKPYIVTEFGPNGPWEVGKTPWGASLDVSSTQKTDIYRNRYEKSVAGHPGWCLGSYAFLWGHKFEATATWFGMFLPPGNDKLGPVDAMAHAWTGKWPETRAPEIKSFASSAGLKEVAPGSSHTVECVATGGGGPLTYAFEVRPETEGPSSFEPGQKPKDAVPGVVPPAGAKGSVPFTAPSKPGPYRLFVYVRDGKGGAATANLPFFVK